MKGSIVRFSDNTFGIRIFVWHQLKYEYINLHNTKVVDFFGEVRINSCSIKSSDFLLFCKGSLEEVIKIHKDINPNPMSVIIYSPSKMQNKDKYYEDIMNDWQKLID